MSVVSKRIIVEDLTQYHPLNIKKLQEYKTECQNLRARLRKLAEAVLATKEGLETHSATEYTTRPLRRNK